MSSDSDVASTASLQPQGVTTLGAPSTSIPDADVSSLTNELSRTSFERIPRSGAARMSSNRTAVSVAVDPVALITTECITVTSAMRKHARWAHSSVSSILGGSSSSPGLQGSRPGTPRDASNRKGQKGKTPTGYAEVADDDGLENRWGLRGKKGKSMQDNPLMAGFGRLRRELVGCKGTYGQSVSQGTYN